MTTPTLAELLAPSSATALEALAELSEAEALDDLQTVIGDLRTAAVAEHRAELHQHATDAAHALEALRRGLALVLSHDPARTPAEALADG